MDKQSVNKKSSNPSAKIDCSFKPQQSDKNKRPPKKDKLSMATYLFHQGTNYRSHYFLGCHHEGAMWAFRVWAPSAKEVYLVGDFNQWKESDPLTKITPNGIYEIKTKNPKAFDAYKFCIVTQKGEKLLKADPYATHNETRPGTASKVYDINGYDWQDEGWLSERKNTDLREKPFNIYEVHLGSWKKHEDGNFLSYSDIAKVLIPYIKQMGYTHIELMPIGEYPFDKSWGYQVTGYFSPTSRYGTPKDFMQFVDLFHQNGIGVLLDWVPAHFPKDAFGLYKFDGTFCYEYANALKGEHPDWGTMVFDYGKNEVISFLVSSACNWIETYHIDGLRVDAVASMLYLDYGRKDGQWVPNKYGKNGNLEAIELLKNLNEEVNCSFAGAVMIAEESTAWPKVSAPVKEGGLGFNFKWNMGWMNDTINYISTDPLFKKGRHSNLTFSFDYAFAENYILPLSHDEVVHGKSSLIGKMPGDYGTKFENLKAYYGYMFSHPGKKLLFMGGEFAQFVEWNEEKELEWFLLEYPAHSEFKTFVESLNKIYLDNPSLWECDHSSEGFQWISGDNSDQNIICYLRYDKAKNAIVSISNFSSLTLIDYKIGVPYKGKYKQILNTSEMFLPENKKISKAEIYTKKDDIHGMTNSISLNLPPFTTIYFYKKASPDAISVEQVKTKKANKRRNNAH